MSILDFFRERKATLDDLAKKRQQSRKSRGRIALKSRIAEVLDFDSQQPLFEDISSADPLEFPGYQEKVEKLARRSGLSDAFVCATGTIKGRQVVCAELVPEFLMGSMGTAVGEAITQSAEYALAHNMPLIIFSASGGARMQEGMFSLMQMAKTSAAIRRLSDAGGLFISVLTHPTTGGVTASFASLGDIIIAEPEALIGFAGPRVIEQTIRATLPAGFQSAEFQRDHGFVDAIVAGSELRDMLARLLSLHPINQHPINQHSQQGNLQLGSLQLSNPQPSSLHPKNDGGAKPAAGAAGSPVLDALDTLSAKTPLKPKQPSEHIEIARHPNRPHAQDFIDALFNGFINLRGDRHFRDDPSILCGLASFEGTPLTIAAHLKGSDLTENIAYNFGMPHPEGYRKFIRLVSQAQKFGRPVVTFIDTPGAYPGAEAEERGQGEAIARCLFTLSGLKVPTIAIITGEGGSGGALALGLADRVYMYEYAVYSVLSPEGFASILWKDAKRAPEAAGVMKLTAQDLEGFAMIDGIIPEPVDGAHNDPLAAIEALRPLLRATLAELAAKDTNTLLAERYTKYRKFC